MPFRNCINREISKESQCNVYPKKTRVVNVQDFRLINLVGPIYKIIFKVSVKRMKMVLKKTIVRN